ncbi:unnamed protein product [Vitrella brassicaformis CCMP3155]|uniref:Uncharacterized protein n=2 Tax=Vitrella brassicaformis TaxID=1169539 RepID=A0A0G4EX15_VITBC|nr:unnamed protein product [Vitrella brassicaformis CCMP3155]|mmetsp:Transcript_53520/g.134718  ORF Transcript_53520/g.134718 Transcript_53520/m.134718 type:complete len:263 (+) Transcript_53520:148-936(+)|eukprot:CEM03323.1 unnamed protein product [Vitrella brassicaformis CCMP3155]
MVAPPQSPSAASTVCSVNETPSKALSSSERARELRRVAMQQCLSLSLLMLFTVFLLIALVGVIFYVFGLVPSSYGGTVEYRYDVEPVTTNTYAPPPTSSSTKSSSNPTSLSTDDGSAHTTPSEDPSASPSASAAELEPLAASPPFEPGPVLIDQTNTDATADSKGSDEKTPSPAPAAAAAASGNVRRLLRGGSGRSLIDVNVLPGGSPAVPGYPRGAQFPYDYPSGLGIDASEGTFYHCGSGEAMARNCEHIAGEYNICRCW